MLVLFLWMPILKWRNRFWLNFIAINISQNMNHQYHFKQIINFKYEIQSTNEIYDHNATHSLAQLTSTYPAYKHEQNTIILPTHQSGHIQPQSYKQQLTHNQTSTNSKLLPTMPKFGKTRTFLAQPKSTPNGDLTVPKQQDKFSTPRKNKNNESKQPPSATPKKRQTMESQENKANYNRKGLALISALIQEVLETHYSHGKRFTCAEISTCVLEEFCKRAELESNADSIDQRERKTIKRRVYDSINVLIALGKIKKDHKWLYVQSVAGNVGQEIVMAKQQTINSMAKELARKQQLVALATKQWQRLKLLKQRNQCLNQSELAAEATVSTYQGHNTFRFPLILVSTQPQDKVKIQLQSIQKTEQVAVSAGQLYVMSQLAALELISFQPEKPSSNLHFQ